MFLRIAGASLGRRTLPASGQSVGTVAGLALVALGGTTMVLATIRFRRTTGDIDAGDPRPGPGTRLDLALVALLLLLGAILFAYMAWALIGEP